MIPLFLTGALGRALGFIRSLSPLAIVIVALGLFAAWEWHLAGKWQRHAVACEAMRNAEHAMVADAQADATRIATEAKRAEEARTQSLKDQADAKLEAVRSDGARRLADFVRTHRPAAQGRAASADLPNASPIAEVDNGTGGSAVVPASDLAICADNTARLTNAHEWGVSLNAPKN